MVERKHLNIQIQANLPHDTYHTKNALTYIKVGASVTVQVSSRSMQTPQKLRCTAIRSTTRWPRPGMAVPLKKRRAL
eukprot:286620-Pelagomonas_calceolata.AAC.6